MARYIYQGTFVDLSGNVVNSGTITVYLAGTTTLASVYAASSGGTAVNSVVSDSTGKFVFYVDTGDYNANQKFDIVLSKAGFLSKTYSDITIFPENEYVYYANASATDQSVDANDNSIADLLAEIGTSDIRTIVCKQGTYTFSTTVNWSAYTNITLKIQPGADFAIATGVTITLGCKVEAGLQKWISLVGTGVIVFGSNSIKEVYPEWWGADSAGVIDSATAIQSAINSIILSGGNIVFGTGTYDIGTTITISDQIHIKGAGDKNGTIIHWIGLAGQPMINITNNAIAASIQNLQLLGNSVNIPSDAIKLTSSGGLGRVVMKNITIGWLAGDEDTGYPQFTYGIRSNSGNKNDLHILENIFTRSCDTAAIYQGSIQNSMWGLKNIEIYGDGVCNYGLYVVADISTENVFFSNIKNSDFYFPATDDVPLDCVGKIIGKNIRSESGRRFIEGLGAFFVDITGGSWQITSNMDDHNDGKVVKTGVNVDQYLALRLFEFTRPSAPATAPYIEMVAAAEGRHITILDGIRAFRWLTGGSNGIDAVTKGVTDYNYVFLREDVTAGATRGYNSNIIGYGVSGAQWDIDRQDNIKRAIVPGIWQSIDAASDAIVIDSEMVLPYNDTAGSITLTSTPTIASGANGQICKIMNIGTQNIVLQDQGTLAGSNLRLTANTITLTPRDSIELIYLTDFGDWMQIGNVVNVL